MTHWRDCDLSSGSVRAPQSGGGMGTVGAVTTLPTHEPERALLSAVLTRAIQDARGTPPKERREARAWLRSDETTDWSFLWLIAQLGFPPCSRWRIWRYVNSPDAPDIRGAPIKAIRA